MAAPGAGAHPMAFTFDKAGAPQFESIDEAATGCVVAVVNAVLRLASYVATHGIGENTAAKGFFLIVGDKGKLTSGEFGTLTEFDMFQGKKITVDRVLNDKKVKTYALPVLSP